MRIGSACHRPRASNRRAGYGSWPRAAAKLPVPKKEELQFRPKSDWRYIGKGTASYDLRIFVPAKPVYGMDARVAGMVYASIEHPPVLGGKVKSYDEKRPAAGSGRETEPFPSSLSRRRMCSSRWAEWR